MQAPETVAAAEAAEPVKRGRGRPRKTPVAASVSEPAAVAAPVEEPKPKRGRKPAAAKEAVSAKSAAPKPRAKAAKTAPVVAAAEAPSIEVAAENTPAARKRTPRSTTRAETRKAAVKDAAEKVAAQDNAPAIEVPAAELVEATPEAVSESSAKRGRRRRGASAKANAVVPAPEAAPAATPELDPALKAIVEAPKPLFSELGLSAPIMRAIEEMGYEHPTPIQARAIPVVLSGQDVLGVAQTGTGKTASFTLPMLERLAGSRARARMPRSLILEPTRELALQVAENLTLYGKHLRLNHALLIGGESMADQRAVLNQGVDILIATPGRLMDLFDRGGLLLTQTGILVIDEADRMLDMGFIPDITRIVSMLPAHRQTLLFSATMAPEIRTLADQFLHLPEEITVSRPSSVATTIEEALLVVDEHEKRRVLRKLLKRENVQNAIVFCNRKRDVDVLYKSLHKHGFSVGHLHGDLAQSLRFKTLERFKSGELQILVCSDVAARGIDIGGLSHVFNFDLPFNAEDYIHRIGRTGRAGKTGHAFSLASPRQKLLAEAIEKLKHAPIPLIEIEGVESLPWADPEQDGAQPERRERSGKERGGRHNRRGENRDRGDRPVANEALRQQPRDRAESANGSIAPTTPFDHDAPRTGFGHDTPAFMLLPRRNRKAENDDQIGPIQHRGTV
ncbi:DEAD/DEAH box helicase [Asaia spathodeae]|uniref:DEAD/DEAH box helicase n=1 Tax=Asaia spathodeae TaxID=657016 RepID=A0ABX2P4L3_9PROT